MLKWRLVCSSSCLRTLADLNRRLFHATCTSHGLVLNFRVQVYSRTREPLALGFRLSLLCEPLRGGRSIISALEKRQSGLFSIGSPARSKFTTFLVSLLSHFTLGLSRAVS